MEAPCPALSARMSETEGMRDQAVPRVSVLMPVFNTAPYLREALISIRSQSFEDFELVVVNDGSTDRSSEILKVFASQEPRVRLIERGNVGLIATRNELLEEARGEFVAWMDSDDIAHSDRLRTLLSKFESDHRIVCVGSNVQVIDPCGKPLGVEAYAPDHEAIRSDQLSGSGMRFPSTMQRRSAAKLAGGFREPFRIGEDLDYLLRVGEVGLLANVESILYYYRQHLSSTCTLHGANWIMHRDLVLSLAHERNKEGADILQRGGVLTLPSTEPTDVRKFVPLVLLSWARGALEYGDRPRALRYLARAVGAAPFKKWVWRSALRLMFSRRLLLG